MHKAMSHLSGNISTQQGTKMTHEKMPLEMGYRTVHSYKSIPDDPYSLKSLRHGHHDASWRSYGRLLLIPLTALSLVSLAYFATLGAHNTVDKSHRETVVPTLLSVVNPGDGTLTYALDNPLYRQLQKAEIVKDTSREDEELPQLWLDKTHIRPGEALVLTWTVGRDSATGNILLKESDVIALHCDEAESFLEAATIDQVRATSKFNGGSPDSWRILSFPHLRQEFCEFRLYTADDGGDVSSSSPSNPGQFFLVSSTKPFRIVHSKETPTAIHLAYTNDTSKMVVQFTTGDVAGAVPVVRVASADSEEWDRMIAGSTDTYSAEDLCQVPANMTQAGNFYPPGQLHSVVVDNLKPDAHYEYKVGILKDGQVLVWSNVYSFKTAPERGQHLRPFSYVVYGDQGCPYSGWNVGQSWLKAMIHRETNLTSVHHFGDIAYAKGAAHLWDSWFDMIQPMSTRVPLMVAIGNHEYDHTEGGGIGKDPSGVETAHGYMPSWGNYGEDSGGECGVPTAKRFQMPFSEGSNGVFWYSFDYGIVHTIVISSEHDLSQGSKQYQFIENDLKSVDRSLTPWVVVESHRPLYEGEGSGTFWVQNQVSQAIRHEIEDLLVAHQVDLVLAGHYHEYQRTCDGVYKESCNRGQGPMHITVGSAGAKLDAAFELFNDFTDFFIKGEFGYGKITIYNKTDLHFEFVKHGALDEKHGGKVLDDVWIHRNR